MQLVQGLNVGTVDPDVLKAQCMNGWHSRIGDNIRKVPSIHNVYMYLL